MKIGILTIGCRANQSDSSTMATLLSRKHDVTDPWSSECDIVIINTCTVTSRADADARKLTRRARRKHPDAMIIVTGCAVQVDPEKWAGMNEVDLVVGIRDRAAIDEIIEKEINQKSIITGPPSGGIDGPTPLYMHRSRPFLKIQDGCSRGCAYCIVPRARGPERSRPLDLIRKDIHNLSEAGYREIVFTGVHLGRWGYEFGTDLNAVLDMIEKIDMDVRFRFSSLEPMDLDPDFVRRLLSIPNVCPHLHLPLQSADDGVLNLMGRGHTISQYENLLEAAVETCPDVSLGADILTGFPGETESAFTNTLKFLNDSPLTYLHVFPYSPRERTGAIKMSGAVPNREISRRVADLHAVDLRLRKKFLESQAGKVRNCLIETGLTDSGSYTGLTDNYISLELKGENTDILMGHIVPVRVDIINVSNDTLTPVGVHVC